MRWNVHVYVYKFVYNSKNKSIHNKCTPKCKSTPFEIAPCCLDSFGARSESGRGQVEEAKWCYGGNR